MTADEVQQAIADLPTTAAKIRALDALGLKRADIARHLSIRYQHVRNVLVEPPRRRKAAAPTKEPEYLEDVKPLTIAQAKKGLALTFDVPLDAIQIVVRA